MGIERYFLTCYLDKTLIEWALFRSGKCHSMQSQLRFSGVRSILLAFLRLLRLSLALDERPSFLPVLTGTAHF